MPLCQAIRLRQVRKIVDDQGLPRAEEIPAYPSLMISLQVILGLFGQAHGGHHSQPLTVRVPKEDGRLFRADHIQCLPQHDFADLSRIEDGCHLLTELVEQVQFFVLVQDLAGEAVDVVFRVDSVVDPPGDQLNALPSPPCVGLILEATTDLAQTPVLKPDFLNETVLLVLAPAGFARTGPRPAVVPLEQGRIADEAVSEEGRQGPAFRPVEHKGHPRESGKIPQEVGDLLGSEYLLQRYPGALSCIIGPFLPADDPPSQAFQPFPSVAVDRPSRDLPVETKAIPPGTSPPVSDGIHDPSHQEDTVAPFLGLMKIRWRYPRRIERRPFIQKENLIEAPARARQTPRFPGEEAG